MDNFNVRIFFIHLMNGFVNVLVVVARIRFKVNSGFIQRGNGTAIAVLFKINPYLFKHRNTPCKK